MQAGVIVLGQYVYNLIAYTREIFHPDQAISSWSVLKCLSLNAILPTSDGIFDFCSKKHGSL
jgi:hypothetical protein